MKVPYESIFKRLQENAIGIAISYLVTENSSSDWPRGRQKFNFFHIIVFFVVKQFSNQTRVIYIIDVYKMKLFNAKNRVEKPFLDLEIGIFVGNLMKWNIEKMGGGETKYGLAPKILN